MLQYSMPPPCRSPAPVLFILLVINKACHKFFLRGNEQPMCFTDGESHGEVNDLSKVIDQVNHIWLTLGSIMAVCPVSSLVGQSIPALGHIPNWVIWCKLAGWKPPLWFCSHLVFFHFSFWHVLWSCCCYSRKMSMAPRNTANSVRGEKYASQQDF